MFSISEENIGDDYVYIDKTTKRIVCCVELDITDDSNGNPV